MKLVSFKYKDYSSIGFLDKGNGESLHSDGYVVDLFKDTSPLPNNMLEYLKYLVSRAGESNVIGANEIDNILQNGVGEFYDLKDVVIDAPLQKPLSFRDAYAFRKHVEAGRKNRGLDMISEYDDFPVFYFSNHHSITGPGNIYVQRQHLKKLDFEFEIGIIIAKKGRNIKSCDAMNYVAGFTIINDWSERDIQLKEMKLNLGPAKGKDFATSMGPYLVTLDELEDVKIIKDDGPRYDLKMKAYINDQLVSEDNFKNMTWSFSDIIERVSSGVDLYPGEIIGSGTCSTGCLLELNLTNKNPYWLKEGDVVRLEVDRLGSLINKICLQK